MKVCYVPELIIRLARSWLLCNMVVSHLIFALKLMHGCHLAQLSKTESNFSDPHLSKL